MISRQEDDRESYFKYENAHKKRCQSHQMQFTFSKPHCTPRTTVGDTRTFATDLSRWAKIGLQVAILHVLHQYHDLFTLLHLGHNANKVDDVLGLEFPIDTVKKSRSRTSVWLLSHAATTWAELLCLQSGKHTLVTTRETRGKVLSQIGWRDTSHLYITMLTRRITHSILVYVCCLPLIVIAVSAKQRHRWGTKRDCKQAVINAGRDSLHDGCFLKEHGPDDSLWGLCSLSEWASRRRLTIYTFSEKIQGKYKWGLSGALGDASTAWMNADLAQYAFWFSISFMMLAWLKWPHSNSQVFNC